jgi:hypothetical protein
MTIIVGAIAAGSVAAGIVVGRSGVFVGAWVAAGAQAFKHIARSIMEVIALIGIILYEFNAIPTIWSHISASQVL